MELSERMKMYEQMFSDKLFPLLPSCARLDGRAFHSFTKGLTKPFDSGLVDYCSWGIHTCANKTLLVHPASPARFCY